MDLPEYSLLPAHPQALRSARRWLLLGVIALGIGGIFAGLLGREQNNFFYTALTIHVDLSVLVWFLAMASMFFALAAGGRGLPLVETAGFYCVAAGATLIALSALTSAPAYMSNYIPVIHHPVFFFGLSLVLCGVALSALSLLVAGFSRGGTIQHFGVIVAACVLLVALSCFLRSVKSLPHEMTGQIFYEYAFWGGGHVLQFAHTQLMMVAWLWLAGAAGVRLTQARRLLPILYSVGLLAALFAPFVYYKYDVMSEENREAFTKLMIHLNGLAPLLLGIMLIFYLVIPAKAGTTLSKICLVMSIFLFAGGGTIGYLIKGSNLIIPSHYHGSIIGITLAFMGVIYLLLPRLGYADVSRSKLAMIQPVIYCSGQLCWMIGMALLGEQGVPRKTPGSADSEGLVLSLLKHSSDGLALIGGLLFVFIVLKAVFAKPKETA